MSAGRPSAGALSGFQGAWEGMRMRHSQQQVRLDCSLHKIRLNMLAGHRVHSLLPGLSGKDGQTDSPPPRCILLHRDRLSAGRSQKPKLNGEGLGWGRVLTVWNARHSLCPQSVWGKRPLCGVLTLHSGGTAAQLWAAESPRSLTQSSSPRESRLPLEAPDASTVNLSSGLANGSDGTSARDPGTQGPRLWLFQVSITCSLS